jgi:tetratricopeptide (TPR) repeat protein
MEAVELESSLSSLEVLDLPAEAEEFVLAQVLIRHQLLAEAQQVLLELAEQPGLRPAVNQKLGNVYLQTGLYYYAEDQFLQAADMFTSLGDIEGQALAYSKLGETYRMLGNNALAIDSFKEAEARFEILGDEASINAVQEKLAELTP